MEFLAGLCAAPFLLCMFRIALGIHDISKELTAIRELLEAQAAKGLGR